MTCLTTWTKPDALGEACKAALPEAESGDAVDDADKAAWRAKRKAARTQAMKDIEREKERNGEKKAKKAKKPKKAKGKEEM
eukprot:CAMPEP_0179303268 /NCGR_PEP_ID=MMETSP0797-20121207/48492_1 /TAXON_ID=47934 /ORGANISM="Dinophysis acuminata, Strain DAEP01" /LENGTH=80 /DNA_ID=CAMNT_0021012823 /DNA_START=27 /DNA_END=269 /DNA_ORIENTATION=-